MCGARTCCRTTTTRAARMLRRHPHDVRGPIGRCHQKMPRGFEKTTLVNIGHLTRSGDGMISQLLAATDARNAEQVTAFTDVYDFVARARRWFPTD